MKRSGTLFSYFQPSENCTPNKKPAENGRQKPPRSTPKANARSKSKISPSSSSSQRGKKTPKANSAVLIGGSKQQPAKGTLVWAKIEGHPWWPGVVSAHPSTGKLSRGRKAPEIHVQFFGKPPTRGWVSAKNTELLNEATIGDHSEGEVGWSEAVQECRGALEMTEEERSKLIVDIPSEVEEEWSGEECNGGSDEVMDSTPSASRKRPPPVLSDEDSEGDIGVRKNLLGRPKRTAAMSVGERNRVKKRARRALDSDNSEDEYCPVGGDDVSSDECSSGVEEVESDTAPSSENEGESIVTPAKKRKVTTGSVSKTPRTPASTKNRTNGHLFNSPSLSPAPATPTLSQSGPFKHETLDWLKEENRKDKNGRTMNNPDYNPRTIAIPRSFLKGLTPGMRQWWEIKADNFDTILMFKVGKFYELYHMDAVTGVKELGLVFMKGVFAHSGFPEVAFGRYAQTLVQKGYKVARVEQTETPQMMEERVKKIMGPTRFDRVVRRELCSVMTKGTRTLGFFDGEITDCEASYLMAVKEKPLQVGGQSVYGVCFVDTSIGKFHLGQFSDDRQCSRLRTLVAHHPPAHVLYERANLSAKTMQVVNQLLSTAIRDCLSPNSEFWDANKTLKVLAEGSYFTSEGEGEFQWPDSLKMMLAEDDSLGLTASDSYELAVSALGACVWCLKRCCIDQELLMMKSIEMYEPVDAVSTPVPITEDTGNQFAGQRMVLDDITLSNLDVMDNHSQTAGTLLERIDHCATPFGKRLLKQWLCSPLCHPQAINERLDAVVDLMDNPSLVGEMKEVLCSLPDLERLLRKIHTMGSTARVKDHPDGRAIFYEQTVYSKRKITDFIVVLEGFRAALKIGELCSKLANDLNSQLLKKITLLPSKGGCFPDMRELLDYFQKSFDHGKARKEGVILPAKGVNLSYDSALRDIAQKERDLEEYLQKQRKRLGCRTIVYWGNGRNRYQLEVPEAVLSRHTPDEYDLKSQKKGFRRYWTPEIECMLEQLVDAEERRDVALKDNMRALFHSFSEHFKLWESAVQCLAVLDVLVSLSAYSSGGEGVMCRPQVTASALPFLDLRAGRHPCITRTFTGDDFIPNDVMINPEATPEGSLCVVVTGPNMGGKSTLLRQTGLIIILAQLGCFVPAESCHLSPVDRVFTRLGASDRIMSGESTFFVELSETSTILQHSTQHSLVLLDELGRGTATYDGTAIACAVVRELAEKTKCRTLFSTHYHSLVEEFAGNPCIALGHMACMVEDEAEGEAEGEETITFLYKFVEGACPKSYGFNAARLAGIPNEVIHVARKKAQDFERLTELQRLFRRLMSPDFEVGSLTQVQQEMSSLS